MLDRALALTLRDFSTYVLIAAVAFLPLHVTYSFVFQDVIEVRDIHPAIAELGSGLQVRGVGARDLSTYRVLGWVVVALEVVALPLLVGATRNALDARERGQLASVRASWSGAARGVRGSLSGLKQPKIIGPSAAFAIAVLVLARVTGALLVEPVPDRFAWAALALVTTTAHSLAAPFVTVPLAWAARDR